MADREFILSPNAVSITFRVEEASMLINSLHLMVTADYNSGFDQWIYETKNALSDEEWIHLKIVMDACHDEFVQLGEGTTFLDYIEQLKGVSPNNMVESVTAWMHKHDEVPSPKEALRDEDTYVNVMREWYKVKSELKGHEMLFDEQHWRMMYRYLREPDMLHELVIDHLTMMWERFIHGEWKKRKPILVEAVKAYSQMDYTGLSPYDVIEAVTGRDMRTSDYIKDIVENSHELVLIPSPHVGPYIGFDGRDHAPVSRLYFGVRLPKGSLLKSTSLNRSELLVRLNALADDTRLRMIELLIEHEELCAQDFINFLDLSQSSASRHLRQLTASGYVKERRKEVAKCYSLNTQRIDDTVSALRQFLMRDE